MHIIYTIWEKGGSGMRRTVSAMIILSALLAGCIEPTGEEETLQQKYFTATYVGSEKCGECHRDKYLEQKNSFHSRMMRDPNEEPEALLGDFESPSDILTFSKDDVAYTIGGSLHPNQYYLTYVGNDLFYLPAKWEVDQWLPRNPNTWNLPNNSWFLTCSGCHSLGADPEERTFVEPAVGCESCHGPGSVHVSTSTAIESRLDSIINPVELPGHQQAQICGQCHTNGHDPTGNFSFPRGFLPGMNLEIYYERFLADEDPEEFYPDGTSKAHHPQYLDWSTSPHAEAGVKCSDCHDPHKRENIHQLREEKTKLCLSCHTITGTPSLTHSIHDFGPCEGCHMAALGYGPSHTFKVVTPEDTINLADGNLTIQPNACNTCHYHEDERPEDLAAVMEKLRKEANPGSDAASS
jgi:predicted CXXCH cytochrome family protein